MLILLVYIFYTVTDLFYQSSLTKLPFTRECPDTQILLNQKQLL